MRSGLLPSARAGVNVGVADRGVGDRVVHQPGYRSDVAVVRARRGVVVRALLGVNLGPGPGSGARAARSAKRASGARAPDVLIAFRSLCR